jgi:hypothetical protein
MTAISSVCALRAELRSCRVVELVLGSTPAGTPGMVDGGVRDRRLKPAGSQPISRPSAAR